MALKTVFSLLAFLGSMFLFYPVSAHGVGERYDVPMPLSLFIAGGAITVVLSFVMVGLTIRASTEQINYPKLNLFGWKTVARICIGPITSLVKVMAVAIFLVVLVTACFGTTRSVENFAPTFIWVIWWVGMGFLVALLGNVWALTNPWNILFTWAEKLYGHLAKGDRLSLGRPYPSSWGSWPAFIGFFVFAWIETSFMESSNPLFLAWLILFYSLYTFAGMFIFGKHVWLRNGEIFSVIFDFLSRFSILEIGVKNSKYCSVCSSSNCAIDLVECLDCYECFNYSDEKQLNLRPPVVGLNNIGIVTPSIIALIMLLLASVTFDGFSATPEWVSVQSYVITVAPYLTSTLINGITISNTGGLLTFLVVFILVYRLFCYFIVRTVSDDIHTAGYVMSMFVFTLVPIALAYNYAHFLPLLLIQGQQIIALASDPFGFNWDLFGTADYLINIKVISARFLWFFSLFVIVLGHIAAVFLSHIRALCVYQSHSKALRSQIPMLVLMVLYTVISLWIVSRPITE
jgi:hypothetical protein